MIINVVIILLLLLFLLLSYLIIKNNIYIWLFSYIKSVFKRKEEVARPMDIIFCLVDHFEPRRGEVSIEKEIEGVDTWFKNYLKILSKHRDFSGNTPKHTFFYPIDEYTPVVLKKISNFCRGGFGEVELHLHHNDDTDISLRSKLEYVKNIFREYNLLGEDKFTKEERFGFIHGNWALDNSRKDGRWCGVNNELKILKESGCYADFTLPSWPSDTQTKKINSIYYAKDTPLPKSHNTGVDLEIGTKSDGDLMIIQGPLTFNWKKRKYGFLPKIENSEISFSNPPTAERIDLWIKQNISIKGKPNWVFIKVYTHGCKEKNLTEDFFNKLDYMFSYLEKNYNDGINYRLHYVTSRQMYNIIKAAEEDRDGNPADYKDYIIELNVSNKGIK